MSFAESKNSNATVSELIYQTALRLLARREHTQLELLRKLQLRGYAADLIQPELRKLSQQNLLSESRFTEAYIHARAQKGYGPVRIRAELQQRGIDVELIQQCLDANAIEWTALAERVRRKRFGRKLPGDFNERARQVRFLRYRGFTPHQFDSTTADS